MSDEEIVSGSGSKYQKLDPARVSISCTPTEAAQAESGELVTITKARVWASIVVATITICGFVGGAHIRTEHRISELDLKWQERIYQMNDSWEDKLESSLRELPPEWVRRDLESLNRLVMDLEQRMRDQEKNGS